MKAFNFCNHYVLLRCNTSYMKMCRQWSQAKLFQNGTDTQWSNYDHDIRHKENIKEFWCLCEKSLRVHIYLKKANACNVISGGDGSLCGFAQISLVPATYVEPRIYVCAYSVQIVGAAANRTILKWHALTMFTFVAVIF